MNDIVRHNNWATAQVLAYCRTLDQATLEASAPGTYGAIQDLLRHIIDSESAYLARIFGHAPGWFWAFDEAAGLELLTERATTLADAWQRFLDDGVDDERLAEARGDDGEVFAVPVGVIIAQALHHANEHRAQICTILGSLGRDTPEVSAWDYALRTRRMTPKQAPSQG